MPRLKSWESPRRQGRNDKGKGGSARKRQLKKRQQLLRNKLKANREGKQSSSFFNEKILLIDDQLSSGARNVKVAERGQHKIPDNCQENISSICLFNLQTKSAS